MMKKGLTEEDNVIICLLLIHFTIGENNIGAPKKQTKFPYSHFPFSKYWRSNIGLSSWNHKKDKT